MRLLFLNPGRDAQGGAERSLALLIGELVGRDHTVAVLAPPGTGVELFAAAGAEVVLSPAMASLDGAARHGPAAAFYAGVARAAPRVLDVAREARTAARRMAVHIVHSNGFRTHGLAPFIRPGVPQVWSLRDVAPSRAQRALLRAAATHVAGIAANSTFTAQQFSSRRRLVMVVHNPVTLGPLPSKAGARRQLGLPPDRPVVAVVSHLHRSKGHHLAIEAIASLPNRPVLALAGGRLYGRASDDYAADLATLARERGCEADVRFLGGVSTVEAVYAAADVVVVPSLHPEGFGRVVVESQLAGLPVVATAHGGHLSLVDDESTGLLVAPGEADALTAALVRLLGDAELARRLGDAGRLAAQRFTPSRHADAVERLYRRVAS